ncbi:MarR family winged helix-turn-helix transcriptional regulator [Paractinoplanes atraurantiacus]|uniref:DNA-binding transcriptional regulator, MarR family n=1 Tax=Paractinoplanes atraurantiacus TaxID=1036182 RepID=A0A285J450_9ACTN|nr:MarR family transcriptional regulator [Actinoplanes atraurantiacus]SNY55054.1 DNA-binding transcriptional regulator, MarR family [Actinoplanes atraurantiacus]
MEEPPNELAWAVHHLATAAAEVDAATARRMGLSAGDFLALKHLMVAEEPIGPVELGRLLGLTSGAATGLVDRLQRAGWVDRAPHPGDRRRQVLTATPRTTEAVLAELHPLAGDIARVSAALPAEHRRLVIDVLHDLARLHRRRTGEGRSSDRAKVE